MFLSMLTGPDSYGQCGLECLVCKYQHRNFDAMSQLGVRYHRDDKASLMAWISEAYQLTQYNHIKVEEHLEKAVDHDMADVEGMMKARYQVMIILSISNQTRNDKGQFVKTIVKEKLHIPKNQKMKTQSGL